MWANESENNKAGQTDRASLSRLAYPAKSQFLAGEGKVKNKKNGHSNPAVLGEMHLTQVSLVDILELVARQVKPHLLPDPLNSATCHTAEPGNSTHNEK